eukprot:CAMPEP_0168405492 /NCGR_PEP_ID=MMETSP0228-20121227/25169_1 /TAXON_ID=133427 /ORGANISM="Protoceratium reticulatum, Strain CCCM 535 (=CCMP 1889)" /LENGTH=351 /DNA_ID=CAMNT_0008419121 /DNA_START=32 /DNA_END=1087 /DNA_ORIENTATION=+
MQWSRRRDLLAFVLLCRCPVNVAGASFVADAAGAAGVKLQLAQPERRALARAGAAATSRGGGRAGARSSSRTASPGTAGCSLVGAAAVGVLTAAGSRRWSRQGRHSGRQSSVRLRAADSPVVLDVRGVLAQSTDEAQKQILNGLDLTIREGEVHAVMGPNGSGKSTLAKVLVGDSAYQVTDGHATLDGQSLFELEPHERALAGLFLAFQSPPAVNGVSNLDFLRASYNAKMRSREQPELDVIEFYGLVTQKLEDLKVNPDFLNRNVNEGFSGGERKRNEMLQMSVLEPKLAILDEIDSGLDIDALKDVADAIARVRKLDKKRSLLVVTHFERFLKYVDADVVHVMHRGGGS